jgi:hypothetical protein
VHASVAFDNSESAILARLFQADRSDLTPEMARYFLQIDFPPHDRERMDALAGKSRQGTLTPQEQAELENYCHVGDLLGLMQSTARRVLKDTQSSD